ncbi:MAG: slipin family protein [Cytophagales bacterium]|nr:slipin family protein [Cytophagales bacterium]
MKRIRINADRVGLLFRKGDYKRVLTSGVYWIGPFAKVVLYNRAEPFNPFVELNLLLKDEKLKTLLEVVEIKDNEIALQYENGNFRGVLTPGIYAFWKWVNSLSFVKADLSKIEIGENIDALTLKRKELEPYVRVCKIDASEKGVLFIGNKFDRVLGPGEYYFWKNATEVTVAKVDLRKRQLEVSGQEILTRDKAALRISLMAHYKVNNIEKALVDNKDYERQLYVLLQLSLREIVGTYYFDELLEKKEALSGLVLDAVKDQARALGVEISNCGVRDIILPGDVKDIMNQVLVAQKKAQANVIMRREETASTRSLLNTAKLMEDNEMLFKLKEMEYVEKIAEKIGEITVAGNGQVLDQLKSIFAPAK